jgi:uncharacterized membrane protein AbrB (regulator of aidB expression)
MCTGLIWTRIGYKRESSKEECNYGSHKGCIMSWVAENIVFLSRTLLHAVCCTEILSAVIESSLELPRIISIAQAIFTEITYNISFTYTHEMLGSDSLFSILFSDMVYIFLNLFIAYLKQTILTLRSLTLYIYGAPILDVSRSHTTTQHSR